MTTLYLRYTTDPNKLSDFAEYASAEQIPIRGVEALSLATSFPPISPAQLTRASA